MARHMIELSGIKKPIRGGAGSRGAGRLTSPSTGELAFLMGPSGSGKSTFQEHLGLSLTYLVSDGDEVAHLSDDALALHPEPAHRVRLSKF